VGKEALEGTVMSQALDLGDPRAKAFHERMQKLYGSAYRWPVVVALGYDGARLTLMAADKAGNDPKGIRNALEQIDGFVAVSGTPSKPFSAQDHECLDSNNVFLGVWRNGEVVRLK
jgi:branched-chain amino acid transport system substrate-binding protein